MLFALTALVGAGWWRWSAPTAAVAATSGHAGDQPLNAAVVERASPLGPAALPAPSLHGTELDGAIGWHADGSVRIDLALRRRFDHLLSSLGEASLPKIRASLEADVTPLAAPTSVQALLAVFDRYTTYLAAVDLLPASAARERLQTLHVLRMKMLGADVARAFYEAEEQADTWSLDRLALAQRTDVTPEARAKALEALEATLAPEAKEVLRQAAELKATSDETAAFEAAGAPPETRRAAREARLGATAAQRLAALDDERAAWQARLATFRRQRDAIEADEALDQPARERALQAILERDFSEPERRRVTALELGPR